MTSGFFISTVKFIKKSDSDILVSLLVMFRLINVSDNDILVALLVVFVTVCQRNNCNL